MTNACGYGKKIFGNYSIKKYIEIVMLIYRFFFGAIYYSLSKYYKGWARLEAAKDAVFRANIIHAIFAIIFLDHISSYFLWHHLSSLNPVLSKILSGIIVMTPVTLVHIY